MKVLRNVIVSSLLLFSGCGTLAGTAFCGGPSPYLGVQVDYHSASPFNGNAIWFFDLPFSFVADTITLPIGLMGWLIWDNHYFPGGGC